MATGERAFSRSRYLWHPDCATARLLWCAAVGVAITMSLPAPAEWRVRALAGWDAGVFLILAIDWWRMFAADARLTAQRAETEDVGRFLVWLTVIGASLFSFFSAIDVLKMAQAFAQPDREVWSTLALLGVALAWALTHTSYALRYAHLHYGEAHRGGFRFPGEEPPTELDFAYVSFTVGMTFAVSDVGVTSREARRTVLGHAIVSFVYNLTILALAIQHTFTLLGH